MPKLENYKALLFDVDNTLSTHREVTLQAIEALQALGNRGYFLGVCSGRGYAALKNYIFPLFPKSAIHIINGGAQIVQSDGEVLWSRHIPADVLQPLTQELLEAKAEFFVSQSDTLYTTDSFLANLVDHPWQVRTEPMRQLSNYEAPLLCVTTLTGQIRGIVQKYEQQLTIKEMPWGVEMYFDITAKHVNKASAIREWSKITEVPLDQVIGFGDSDNDLEFLASVGYAVAMGNANENIKALANRVIGRADEGGVGIYLEALLKGEDV